MRDDTLFCRKGDLRRFLAGRQKALKDEIDNLETNYILNVSEEDLCQHMLSKYLIESPALIEGNTHILSHEDVDIDVRHDPMRDIDDKSHPFYVKGTKITIAVPFKGDEELFQYQPSRFDYNLPQGVIRNQQIHLIYRTIEHDAERIKEKYNRAIEQIKKCLDVVKSDVEVYTKQLDSFIRKTVCERKNKLLADQSLVASLGIPIKRREDLPQTYNVPISRKKLRIERPIVKAEAFEPEPALAEEEYENILQIVFNMTLVMERSPDTFCRLSEEEIRDHFLMHLNGHYEGQATGETFNYHGKTDILIRVQGKNIFIAECKIWRGEKGFLETIDQLLGYTSWRDTKTAILIFNRNQDFSSVLAKIHSTAKTHTCYKRENNLKDDKLKNETTFSYIFHQPSDKNREMIVTVMAFNVSRA